MLSINLGIMVTQQPTTELSVELPAYDPDATVRIARDGTRFIELSASESTFSAMLTPGQYVLQVDSKLRPSTTKPFTVRTNADASFWSAAHPDPGTVPRPWQGGTGRVVLASDPKDPWPPPPARSPASDAFLTTASPIAGAMRALLDANVGRGADPERPHPRTYALLIGIDQYRNGPGHDGAIYRNLHGCVNDVLQTEKLLRTQIPDIQIIRLLAPTPNGPGSDLVIAAESVPTYANIVAAWRGMIDAARPGDIIYIHYSGHGGRAKTKFPDYKPSGLDESLVPCDINDRERGQYLRDVEIALLLQRMAERDLVTTVVLDSCHSGGATKGDQAQTRQGDRPDIEARGSDELASAVGTADELAIVAQRLARNATDATWRVDATGKLSSCVTVIAACRQTEAAHEYSPDGGRCCGVLSYFWLEALAQRGATTTYRRIYDQVFGNVHNVFYNQTPLLLGLPERLVLGAGTLRSRPSVPVLKVTGNDIELGAGASALIERGTHLAIVPPDQLPELVDLAQLVEVEVQSVGGMTALARRVPGTGAGAAIAVGAQGIVRSYASRMQRSIRLIVPPQAPTQVFDDLASAITNDTSKLLTVTKGSGGDYQVLVDGDTQTYRICDAAGAELPHVTATPIAARDAAAQVVETLVHLARYSNVLALANNDPNASLADKVRVELLGLPDYDPGVAATLRPVLLPPGPVRIPAGEFFCLRIHNGSQYDLQLALLDLQPDWGISLIPDIPDLVTGETRDVALQTSLPDGFVAGRDVLKVLAALAGPDVVKAFLLELPALGKPRATRTAREPDESALNELIRIMQDPLEQGRHAALPRSPSRGWTMIQAEIEVFVVAHSTRYARDHNALDHSWNHGHTNTNDEAER
jgi:hypothetical protein